MSIRNVTGIDGAATGSLLDFGKAEARRGNPTVVREEIKKAFRDGDLWKALRPYLLQPGVEGNRSWDQCLVVKQIMQWDKDCNHSRIAGFKLPGPVLWKMMYSELSKVFQTSGGRVIGFLEIEDQQGEAEKLDDDDDDDDELSNAT